MWWGDLIRDVTKLSMNPMKENKKKIYSEENLPWFLICYDFCPTSLKKKTNMENN